MNKLSTQAKSQFSYMKAHKGKMIGTGLGITTGIVYGMSGKKDNMMIVGLAIVGAAAGAILGGMFDKPEAVIVGTDENGNVAMATANIADEEGMSNAIGRMSRRYVKSGGVTGGCGKCNCNVLDEMGNSINRTIPCVRQANGRCGCPSMSTVLEGAK